MARYFPISELELGHADVVQDWNGLVWHAYPSYDRPSHYYLVCDRNRTVKLATSHMRVRQINPDGYKMMDMIPLLSVEELVTLLNARGLVQLDCWEELVEYGLYYLYYRSEINGDFFKYIKEHGYTPGFPIHPDEYAKKGRNR